MIWFFPDLNVWTALSVAGHSHSAESWNWLNLLPRDARLIFCRYTQMGLLRLLTNPAVMGTQTLTLRQSWNAYDRWMKDPRVEFHPESPGLERSFREATAELGRGQGSKWVGDCYLLAYAKESNAPLVTFDKALAEFAGKHGYSSTVPA